MAESVNQLHSVDGVQSGDARGHVSDYVPESQAEFKVGASEKLRYFIDICFKQRLHFFAFNGGNDLTSTTLDAEGINFASLRAVKYGWHYHTRWFVLIGMS